MKTVYNYQNLKKQFSKQELTKLLIEEKYTYRELQYRFSYSERLWSKLAQEYDIPKVHANISKHLRRFQSEEIAHIIYLYIEQKMSLRQIAKLYKSEHSVIKKYLLASGVSIRNGNDPSYYDSRKSSKIVEDYVDDTGYVRLGSQRQHRIIMERHLNRPLKSNEYVHHIDFNKTNNDINNLFIFADCSEHQAYHGYLISHSYVHPHEFLNDIYPKIQLYKTKDFLYEQYIVLDKSIAQINKDIDNYISRTTLSKLLKQYGLFDNTKHIN